MSEEFDSRKYSRSWKLEWRPWIFVKLSFRELCGSKLSGLHPFDNMVIIHWVKNRLKTERLTVSSWDTNPWSNFCDSHWKLICCNKWDAKTSEISTPPERAVGSHFHAQHSTKTILVFLLADGEASWSLLPSSVSLLSGGTVQPENTYSSILKVTGQIWESQKRISINTNHNYHQRSSPKASHNWSNNKIRFSHKQPSRKRWDARLVEVIKHLPHKVLLLWCHHKKGGQPRLKRHLLPTR